jgi:hypothetical protein
LYHGFARSAGLGFWPSLGLTFAGSAGWEIAGESTRPSRNDQVASGIGGSFLGEPLYRMANLLLEHGGNVPARWREAAAAVIAPANGFNRLVYGKGMGSIFDSKQPAYYSRLQLGFMGTAQNQPGFSALGRRNEAQVDFLLDYGLPGKYGYTYTRPFDYFAFRATASSANGFSAVMTRGLLVGRDYAVGDSYRGIWGLYGTYDYFAPDDFRLSTTAFAFGTTFQAGTSGGLMVQSTALLGAGYAAARALAEGNDDYHYGITPQTLGNLRLIAGSRAALDMTAREYFISGVGGFGTAQRDLIFVGDASLALRLFGRHALALTYQRAGRSSEFFEAPKRSQARSRVGDFYTFLGSGGFGAVP